MTLNVCTALIHAAALLSRVPFALAGLSCLYIAVNKIREWTFVLFSQANWSGEEWTLQAKVRGQSFSGPDVLKAAAGQVTNYPLKFLPLSEGAVEVMFQFHALWVAYFLLFVVSFVIFFKILSYIVRFFFRRVFFYFV